MSPQFIGRVSRSEEAVISDVRRKQTYVEA